MFGRVTPQQKRAMVRALQARGHTVAMTGDGVNDALALKDADIGVAMGSGSDATRAVAQLVLLDSTFDALPPVVAEGRRVLGNIERTSGLYLTKTVYAMLLALATGVAGFVFPFLPRHLTLVGALTIGIPSFFLALAPNTRAVPAGVRPAGAPVRDPDRRPRGDRDLPRVRAGHERGGRHAGAGADRGGDDAHVDRAAGAVDRGRAAHAVATGAGVGDGRVWPCWRSGVPAAETFFALEPPPPIVWLAGIGIAALVWSFARLFVPGGAAGRRRGTLRTDRDLAGRTSARAATRSRRRVRRSVPRDEPDLAALRDERRGRTGSPASSIGCRPSRSSMPCGHLDLREVAGLLREVRLVEIGTPFT